MKKVIYTFALLAVSLMSCESSSDDETTPLDATPTNETILPTQLDIVYSDGETETITYSYDGMKLIKEESSDGYYTDYVYTDNKLSAINYYEDSNAEILESYTYDAQGRVETISTNIIGVGIYEYSQTYNSDNSVITQTSTTSAGATPSTTTVSNGNVVNSTDGTYYTTTFNYDSKNGVFKNIDVRDVLVTIESENGYATNFTLNNRTSEQVVYNQTLDSENYTYTMTYTSFDYPRTIQESEEGDITLYTYTYNND